MLELTVHSAEDLQVRSHFLLLEMYAAQITKLKPTHLQPIWLFHTDLSERCMRGCNRAQATS